MQTLKLQAEITLDYLSGVEQQLSRVILQRLKEKDLLIHSGVFHKKFVPAFYVFIKVLCGLLLILAGFLIFKKASVYDELSFHIFTCLFACAILFLFWDREKLEGKLAAIRWRVFSWAANKRARMMLKQASKLVPFQAEYDLRGDVIVYYRIKNAAATFVWNRKIKGSFFVGQGFTLLFKTAKHQYPFAIILHEHANELEDYLKTQSCLQLTH